MREGFMEKVELTFKYLQEEWVKAQRQYLFASKTITKTSVAIVGAYFLFALVHLFASSFSALSLVLLGIAVLAILTGGALYFYMPAYNFARTAKYHEEYTLLFSKEGIKFKTPTINSQLQWNIYSELWESDAFYFLIQGVQTYTLVPKRAFQNAEEKQVFEEMALSELGGTKRII